MEVRFIKFNVGVEKFGFNVGIFIYGVGNFVYIGVCGFVESRYGVDGGDMLCKEGICSKFWKFSGLEVGGDDVIFGDLVGVDCFESCNCFLVFGGYVVID